MNKAEKKSFRSKSLSEMKAELVKLKINISKEIVELKSGKNTNPKKKRELRRDISQISTIIREKELVESLKHVKEELSVKSK
ncbi:50S ribosomal protein L29 [Candidatus Woesebacteria bacterium]|nr:MAG: 50S ribosomal protein L29 [Candidatus Woesebacteria bacterium]